MPGYRVAQSELLLSAALPRQAGTVEARYEIRSCTAHVVFMGISSHLNGFDQSEISEIESVAASLVASAPPLGDHVASRIARLLDGAGNPTAAEGAVA